MDAPKFQFGQLLATPAALRAIEASGDDLLAFVRRHLSGDWGDLDEHDRRMNDESVILGGRLLSVYVLKSDARIWVITEGEDASGERESTTVLLPSDY